MIWHDVLWFGQVEIVVERIRHGEIVIWQVEPAKISVKAAIVVYPFHMWIQPTENGG